MNPVELTQSSPATRRRILELLGGAPNFYGGVVVPSNPPERSVWVNEETGQFLVRLGTAWVEISSGAQVGYSQIPSVIQGVLWDIPATYNNTYVRRSHTAAFNTRIQTYHPTTAPYGAGMRVTLRNASPTHTMTVLAAAGVTLNFAAGSNLVLPGRNVTLLHTELNQWDLLI